MKRFSTKARERLYDYEKNKARAASRGEFPICNLCDLPVLPGEQWDESHHPVPKALGGKRTGIAHRFRCNRVHGSQVVTPMVADAKRGRQKHIGAFQTRQKLPGGRSDPRKRTMSGRIVDRATGLPWGSH